MKIVERDTVEVSISNDGKNAKDLVEGDGIRGMRNRVKELNGSLEILMDGEFTVRVKI